MRNKFPEIFRIHRKLAYTSEIRSTSRAPTKSGQNPRTQERIARRIRSLSCKYRNSITLRAVTRAEGASEEIPCLPSFSSPSNNSSPSEVLGEDFEDRQELYQETHTKIPKAKQLSFPLPSLFSPLPVFYASLSSPPLSHPLSITTLISSSLLPLRDLLPFPLPVLSASPGMIPHSSRTGAAADKRNASIAAVARGSQIRVGK